MSFWSKDRESASGIVHQGSVCENSEMASPSKQPPRIVMIAIDGSSQAENAFDWYAEFIHKEENRVILVHAPECVQVTESLRNEKGESFIQKILAKDKKESEEMKSKYSAKVKEQEKIKDYQYETAYGEKPSEALVKAAEDLKVDMVIMGTRGLGTIRRTIMGSVSDYVVHHAHCPVIVCRH